MANTWLILDAPFLCRRAQHSVGSLAFAGEPTGVIFGFFRAVIDLQRRFGTEKVIFCWDHGLSLRQELFPDYKLKRRNRKFNPEEKIAEDNYRTQVFHLKHHLLFLGYANVFFKKGYEADDLIASLCLSLRDSHPEDDVVLVSADKDLFQLLDEHTIFWSPSSKVSLSSKSIFTLYGVRPDQWAKVKAIAGCTSDGIPGVRGVGEKTACQYLNGMLKEKSKKYQAIEDNWDVVLKNLRLTSLPFPTTPTFKLQEDDVKPSKWKALTDKLGMGSLREMFR